MKCLWKFMSLATPYIATRVHVSLRFAQTNQVLPRQHPCNLAPHLPNFSPPLPRLPPTSRCRHKIKLWFPRLRLWLPHLHPLPPPLLQQQRPFHGRPKTTPNRTRPRATADAEVAAGVAGAAETNVKTRAAMRISMYEPPSPRTKN